jgi:tetratricopeptide (TPR) repeat protein
MRRGAAILILVWAGAAAADARDEAREHYRKGTQAFELSLFDEAIDEYMHAYRLHDDPALLYNLGQAHRQAGHTREAIRFYRVYLNRVPQADNRAEVMDKLDQLQRALAVEPHPAAPPPAPPPSELSRASAPPHPAVTRAPTPGRRLRIAGATTAACALALLAGGIATGVLAQKAANDVVAEDRNGQAYDPHRYATWQSDRSWSAALLGVGGAALLGGAVTFAVGQRRAHREALHVVPLLSTQRAGLSLEGGF